MALLAKLLTIPIGLFADIILSMKYTYNTEVVKIIVWLNSVSSSV